MAKVKITELVALELKPFLEENGYELFNTEFVKEGREWYLRVYIEKCKDGEYQNVGTDDCELVSRYLSQRLDELDPIEQNYYLEVSSPGMDRPLLCEEHYSRFTGELVDLSLYEPFEGSKLITGTLEGLKDGCVAVNIDGKTIEIPMDKIARTKLAVIF